MSILTDSSLQSCEWIKIHAALKPSTQYLVYNYLQIVVIFNYFIPQLKYNLDTIKFILRGTVQYLLVDSQILQSSTL